MAEEKLYIGDVVKLKSGSPDMTIAAFYSESKCKCVWYENGEVKTTPELFIQTIVKVA